MILFLCKHLIHPWAFPRTHLHRAGTVPNRLSGLTLNWHLQCAHRADPRLGGTCSCKDTAENAYLTRQKWQYMELIPFFPSSLWFLIWLKRWVNAEGEPKGQSCPRQTGGRPALFLWVLFQIGVGFEAEVVSELVPPLAFFTDTQTHTRCPSQTSTPAGLDSDVQDVRFVLFSQGHYLL